MIPKSGGDYQYILSSLGQLPAFLFLWVALLIIIPTGNAVLALTFSSYTLQPFWPDCAPPDLGVRLLSGAVICMNPDIPSVSMSKHPLVNAILFLFKVF